MKILVCGSREWTDPGPIERELRKYGARLPVVIHGANGGFTGLDRKGPPIGADFIAGQVARALGYQVREYPVTPQDWAHHGRAAGPRRNAHMLEVEHLRNDPIGLVLAFAVDFTRARGTNDMRKKARAKGIVVESFSL